MFWLSKLRALPSRWVIISAVSASCGIGLLDSLTGWEISLFFFYAMPVFIIGYVVTRRAAVVFALLSASLWWVGNRGSHPYHSEISFAWVTATRAAYLLFVAFGAGLLKELEMRERERSAAVGRELLREAELRRVMLNEIEEQQRTIGSELHDGVCQMLSGTALAMESLATRIESKVPSEAVELREVEGYIREALSETRQLAHGLFPVQMGSEGLPVALDEFASMCSRAAGSIRVTFLQNGPAVNLPPETTMHLYRIAQEAVNNAIKHSKARHIAITLTLNAGSLKLEVADDGVGFADVQDRADGIGLRVMAYRAAQIGARIEVMPRPPRGTRVVCLLSKICGSNYI